MSVTEGNLSTLRSSAVISSSEPRNEPLLHTHAPSPKQEEGGLNDDERNTLLSIINKPQPSPSHDEVSFGELLKKDEVEKEEVENEIRPEEQAAEIPSQASIYYNPDDESSSSSSSEDEKEESKAEESLVNNESQDVTISPVDINLQTDPVVEEIGEGNIVDKTEEIIIDDSENETSPKEDLKAGEDEAGDNDTEQQGDDKI